MEMWVAYVQELPASAAVALETIMPSVRPAVMRSLRMFVPSCRSHPSVPILRHAGLGANGTSEASWGSHNAYGDPLLAANDVRIPPDKA